MKLITILIILSLTSCAVNYEVCYEKPKAPHRLIDQKDDFIWIGEDQTRSYSLFIDGNERRSFYGKLIINNTDTLWLNGYEGTKLYSANYKLNIKDSTELTGIFILTKGFWADTIEVKNKSKDLSKIPGSIILLKRGR